MKLSSWMAFLLAGFFLVYSGTSSVANAENTDWTGFYVGGNLGWGENQLEGAFDTEGASPITFFDFVEDDSLVGGGQFGYNYQSGDKFIGLEFSAGHAGMQQSFKDGEDDVQEFKTDWYATGRLRIGLVFNNLLAYISGGISFAQSELTLRDDGTTSKFDFDTVGGVVSGGLEYMVFNRISVMAETRYLFLDEFRSLELAPDGDEDDSALLDGVIIILFGMNYHF